MKNVVVTEAGPGVPVSELKGGQMGILVACPHVPDLTGTLVIRRRLVEEIVYLADGDWDTADVDGMTVRPLVPGDRITIEVQA